MHDNKISLFQKLVDRFQLNRYTSEQVLSTLNEKLFIATLIDILLQTLATCECVLQCTRILTFEVI